MTQLHPVNKILITNIVSLNPGDAAILSGTIEILRKKYGSNVDVVIFDKCADAAKKYYPWASFRQSLFPSSKKGIIYRALNKIGYSHWAERFRFIRFYVSVFLIKNRLSLLARGLISKSENEALSEYVTADLILSTGGTYLIENYNLLPAIMDYRISMMSGTQFGFFTQTLGPYKDKKNQKAFKTIFSNASVILLRDKRSKNHVLELGVSDKNIYLAADAAFVLARNMIDMQARSDNIERLAPATKVAISVRSMENFHPTKCEQYFKAIVLATTVAVEEFGAKITFLSTCQGIDEYWANDDKTADEIYSLLPENVCRSVEIDRKFRQPWEIVKKYQSFDAVIATRMHAAILSLCAGTPTLGFAYEFKMEELFKTIKMDELVINIDSFLLSDATNCVRCLLSKRDFYKVKVAKATENMSKQAWSAEHALPNIKINSVDG